jgi:hypothetical protein
MTLPKNLRSHANKFRRSKNILWKAVRFFKIRAVQFLFQNYFPSLHEAS